MEALAVLLPEMSGAAWTGFVVFLRTAAIVALMPAFGEQSVPVRVRLALAIAFTLIVAPAAPIDIPDPDLRTLVHFTASEVLIGTAIGLALRLFILALQTAGSIAAQSTSLAQMIGGAVEPMPAMGYVLVVTGLALAVTFGLHVKVAALIIETYQSFPAGTFPNPAALADWGVGQVAHAFRLAFAMAVPFVIASFVYNLTLGVINRAMPQLMVAFVGAPFTTFGGLALLFLATPIILNAWHDALDVFLAAPLQDPQ